MRKAAAVLILLFLSALADRPAIADRRETVADLSAADQKQMAGLTRLRTASRVKPTVRLERGAVQLAMLRVTHVPGLYQREVSDVFLVIEACQRRLAAYDGFALTRQPSAP